MYWLHMNNVGIFNKHTVEFKFTDVICDFSLKKLIISIVMSRDGILFQKNLETV